MTALVTDTYPCGDAVDLQAVLRECHVPELLAALERDLVGLFAVKQRVRDTAAYLVVARARRSLGLSTSLPPLHMSFTGNRGTGKTSVAKTIGEILNRLGYSRQGHLVVVTRDDLVGQHAGHTAPKTQEVLRRAMGGVLFIDQAYSLYRPENERDYGREAIEVLLQAMESQRDDLVVILAGYKDRMKSFFDSNPRLFYRIAHHIDFPDYSGPELFEIAEGMLAADDYCLDSGARSALLDYIMYRRARPHFANARSIRDALVRARLRQASRLFARSGAVSREDLRTITALDLKTSRVFAESSKKRKESKQ